MAPGVGRRSTVPSTRTDGFLQKGHGRVSLAGGLESFSPVFRRDLCHLGVWPSLAHRGTYVHDNPRDPPGNKSSAEHGNAAMCDDTKP